MLIKNRLTACLETLTIGSVHLRRPLLDLALVSGILVAIKNRHGKVSYLSMLGNATIVGKLLSVIHRVIVNICSVSTVLAQE